MRRKSRTVILFALVLLLLIPGMAAEAKTKPKLAAKKKTITVGQTYKLKLNDHYREIIVASITVIPNAPLLLAPSFSAIP